LKSFICGLPRYLRAKFPAESAAIRRYNLPVFHTQLLAKMRQEHYSDFQHDLPRLKSFICGLPRFLRAKFPAEGAAIRRYNLPVLHTQSLAKMRQEHYSDFGMIYLD